MSRSGLTRTKFPATDKLLPTSPTTATTPNTNQLGLMGSLLCIVMIASSLAREFRSAGWTQPIGIDRRPAHQCAVTDLGHPPVPDLLPPSKTELARTRRTGAAWVRLVVEDSRMGGLTADIQIGESLALTPSGTLASPRAWTHATREVS